MEGNGKWIGKGREWKERGENGRKGEGMEGKGREWNGKGRRVTNTYKGTQNLYLNKIRSIYS